MNLLKDPIIHQDLLDLSNPKVLERLPYSRRRSPLMVTLADPKTASQDIQKMMELGANIIKFKTSHCTQGEKVKLLAKLEKAVSVLAEKYSLLDWPITTCIELKTCIVKTGFLEGDLESISLVEGTSVVLVYNTDLFDKCTTHRIFIDNPYIAVDVKVGMSISIAHDEIVLQCTKIIDNKTIKCMVTKSGKLKNMCLVAVRGATRSSNRPLLTKKDLQIINFAIEYKIDMIIINYSRQPERINKVKEYIGRKVKRPILLAGICSLDELQNFEGILKESDGIVFSREFLAYELDDVTRYRLMQIQKMVGAKCQLAGKPFFVSGEVFRGALDTGEYNDSETSDITNAILDGVTGFILRSCDDNIENYLEVIGAMNTLCCSVEPLTNSKTHFWRILEGIPIPVNAAEAAAISCAAVAHQMKAPIIIIPTVTGYTAKTLMWLHPASLVITISTKTSAIRRLQSYRCVVPMKYKGGQQFDNWHEAVQARVEFAVEYAVKQGWLKVGDNYVTLQRGSEDSAFCDMVRIWLVTIAKTSRVECPDPEDTKKETASHRKISSEAPNL